MGRFLRTYGVDRFQQRQGNTRGYAYRFPALSEMRAAFNRQLALEIAWSDAEADWAGDEAVAALARGEGEGWRS